MGTIHLYTGPGKGKTASALGIALRALGHGHKVTVVQFLKHSDGIGEVKAAKKIRGFSVHQFGRKGFHPYSPEQQDYDLALTALEFAKKKMKERPNLLVLDEINTVLGIGLLKLQDILPMLKRVPKNTHVYLTGDHAPQELIRYVDFWTEVSDRKRTNVKPRQGIEW